MSVCLRTKWLWVQIPLLSPQHVTMFLQIVFTYTLDKFYKTINCLFFAIRFIDILFELVTIKFLKFANKVFQRILISITKWNFNQNKSRSRINVKKVIPQKSWPATGENFFHVCIAIFNFLRYFKARSKSFSPWKYSEPLISG